MLEPVSLGQGRTHCPGLAADERGVVMGRRLALLFPDVARAVGFFRSYSREVALDEILSSLEIVEAVSERGGREIMVRFEASGSYVADRAAQAARMHKGRAFTGTEVHYVPGFVSGGAGLKHDCPPSRGIGKSQAKKELKTCGEKLVRACA